MDAMSLATDLKECAAPGGEGMPLQDAVDIGRIQRDIEYRLRAAEAQEKALWLFAASLLLGSLFAAMANGLLAVSQSLPDVKPAWWSNESEGEFSKDPEDGYPYDE